MRTRPKDLGTRFETWCVNHARAHNLPAERLAEGGAHDLGDIRIADWTGECKDRMALNIHQTLARAIAKSGTTETFVVWRKMTRKNGNTNRTQDGPVIVAITLDRFLELLTTIQERRSA